MIQTTDILRSIGNAPLVPLQRIVPSGSARVVQATGYYALADEPWQQTGGAIHAFVQVVGTCGSLRGIVTALSRPCQRRMPRPWRAGLPVRKQSLRTSTGANVVASLRVAARLGAGKTVVTIAVDHGLKYISTELYGQ